MRRLPSLLGGLAALAALVVVAQAVLRSQTGPLALVGVFEIHLLAVAAVLALLALPGTLGEGRGRAQTRVVLLAVIVASIVRGGGELWSPGPGAGAGGEQTLTVLTWNLELGSKPPAVSVGGIAEHDADLVSLQELTLATAAAIEADPTLRARYPYRIVEPDAGTGGLGILSKRPLILGGSEREPLILRAGLPLDDGRTVEVLDVHPYPPGLSLAWRLPVGLDARRRDGDLSVIAARAGAAPGALVAGDLNTSPTEPGFAVLADLLTDAHAAVGTGPGFTWRPSSLEGLGVGALRIDHVMTGPWLTPVATSVDCSLPGDHCRLLVTLRVNPAAS